MPPSRPETASRMADTAVRLKAAVGSALARPSASLSRRVFASRAYPLVFQVIFGLVFVLVLYFAFWGPPLGENNLAVVLTWKLWWPLLPLSFLLFGRLWCGVCPIGSVNEVALKLPAPKRRMPDVFFRRYGAWIMASAFLGFFWIGVIRHICCWPVATGIVLLLFVAGAFVAGLLYRGRAWCRYMCPVGIFGGLLSLTAMIGLRSSKSTCRERCSSDWQRVLREEAGACPLYELPMAMESNRNCNLCGQCVKFCHQDSMHLGMLHPGVELSRLKRPLTGEAFFLVALLAVAFVEVIQTTRVFPSYMKWVMESTPFTSYDVAFSVSFVALAGLMVAAHALASHASARLARGGRPLNLSRFAYAFVPLVLAGYLGLAVLRVGSHGVRAVQVTVNQLAFSFAPFDLLPPVRGSFYDADPLTKALQIGILAAGTLGALYVVRRVAAGDGKGRAWARALPHIALVLLVSGIFGFAFLLPSGVILH